MERLVHQRATRGRQLGAVPNNLSALIDLEFIATWLQVGIAVQQVSDLDGDINQRLSQAFKFLARPWVDHYWRRA